MAGPYRILVVDDEVDVEPLVLQRMRREVRNGIYEFLFAHNGVEALEILNADENIDMVLSDINMPEMDGLTLLQQIPSVNPNIRSVIVSAYGDMKNIRVAMNRGAFDFITKPIDFEDLKITIGRTVQHLKMWREALQARDRLISLQNELGIAKEMQQSILPSGFPSDRRYEVFGAMEPARDVGGDFFDIMRLTDSLTGIAIADVSDKGVPAALFMMSSRTLLKGAATGGLRPSEALQEINMMLSDDNDAGMFVTVCYAIYDLETGMLSYSNGGHNAPMLVRADGGAELIEMPPGIALGVWLEADFGDRALQLNPGDLVFFYTDGVTEAMNEADEEFGEARLLELGAAAAGMDPQQICQTVIDAVREFAGDAPQSDDITCAALKRELP
ncbi:MAG: fused response regulator/phosphatase [Rhodobacteraceae bacterium]|nr:fused response regulator/phosphatase [Paracoccaceae bacterium]